MRMWALVQTLYYLNEVGEPSLNSVIEVVREAAEVEAKEWDREYLK